jgi:hypothetical protein
MLDVLAGEWIPQLGGEDRQAAQEEDDVEAVVVLFAVAKLPPYGEHVRLI